MSINDLTGQTKAFAEACYDTNSIDELSAPHAPADADEADMQEWGITAEQWSQAIEAARQEMLADA